MDKKSNNKILAGNKMKRQVSLEYNKKSINDNSSGNLSIKSGGFKVSKTKDEKSNNSNKSQAKSLRINKDWTIAEIFRLFPDKIDELSEVMMNYGLHCVGCEVNSYESLEQGCLGHGFDKEVVKELVDSLNKVASKDKNEEAIVTLTDSAKRRLVEILNKKSREVGRKVFLRINCTSGGESDSSCCQTLYSLSFEKEPKEDDSSILMEDSSITAIVKKSDIGRIDGIEVDYFDNGEMKGFRISNNKLISGCGCRT